MINAETYSSPSIRMSKQECHNIIDSVKSQLFTAVEQNDRCKLMEVIRSSHCNPRFVRNEKKETLLHIASKLGLIDMICITFALLKLTRFLLLHAIMPANTSISMFYFIFSNLVGTITSVIFNYYIWVI